MWLDKIFGNTKKPEQKAPSGFFSTDLVLTKGNPAATLQSAINMTFQKPLPTVTTEGGEAITMDESTGNKAQFNNGIAIPEAQVAWYGSQSFIGYQVCAILDQQWLIDKACLMPGRDAVRNGFEVSTDAEVAPEILAQLTKMDQEFKLNKQLVEFVHMGRVFGIRIAMFLVESSDPDYYSKPFNPDGVTPGSYRGITQVDPYWTAPMLDGQAASNPADPGFYTPTWWMVNGRAVHKSHLVIFKTGELPDILKPTYQYGGIPIPQRIAERVYAAERTANEGPLLAMTKRTTAIHTDVAAALADQESFDSRIAQWVRYRDNMGIKILGTEEAMEQFDTSLTDLDAIIMTQYQLVAAAAEVPATKLLGTSPKGFNATGEYEEANYHEMLESIQTHDLTPFVERHHMLCIRSRIAPDNRIAPFNTEVVWKPLDSPTATEVADLNLKKAQTAQALSGIGAIDGQDERDRLIADPDSGYAGLSPEAPEEIMEDPLDPLIPAEEPNPANV